MNLLLDIKLQSFGLKKLTMKKKEEFYTQKYHVWIDRFNDKELQLRITMTWNYGNYGDKLR